MLRDSSGPRGGLCNLRTVGCRETWESLGGSCVKPTGALRGSRPKTVATGSAGWAVASLAARTVYELDFGI